VSFTAVALNNWYECVLGTTRLETAVAPDDQLDVRGKLPGRHV
jgi:hypothetical protein